mmetsp:Transcript_44583/g.71662  ORF Transcript_44583/g.71662 Transcript_44583/m.71662 type:complete len:313 (+) Transcript_44583:147-1085(+)
MLASSSMERCLFMAVLLIGTTMATCTPVRASIRSRSNIVTNQRRFHASLLPSLKRCSRRSSLLPHAEALSPSSYQVPQNSENTADQAFEAVKNGFKDGKNRQQIELMLPLIGATDLDDWPGGIRQQFKAASPMCESILKSLRRELGLASTFTPKILDDGDATAAWESDKITAILFPTAETMSYISTAVDKGDDRLVLLINPQWNKGGANVFSDFGWGSQKDKAEKLLKTFEFTYSFEQRKQGGANIKLLRSYPKSWEVLITEDDQQFDVIGKADQRPSYKDVDLMLKTAFPEENIFSRFMKDMETKKGGGFF